MSSSNAAGDLAEMALLIRGYQISKMIEVAVAIGLADRLNETPRAARELANECEVNSDMLFRLCRALATFGVFAVDAEGNVAHTGKSRCLRSDAKPTLHYAARYMCMPSIWSVWGKLEHALRSGRPPFEAVHGASYFDFMKAHPADADIFDRYMQHSPDDRHAAVVEAYDFSGAHVVVDVGGGNGALLARILTANPEMRGVLLDSEAVVVTAGATLGDLVERCAIRPGDFFEGVPADGDVYTLSQILHDWSDDRCLRLLANCRVALKPGARLLIIERVLGIEDGLDNPASVLSDMHMMTLFPGAKERTLAEYSRLLRDAGFAEPTLIRTRSLFSILETRPEG